MRRMPRRQRFASISRMPSRVEPMQDRCGAAVALGGDFHHRRQRASRVEPPAP
jgi:hypothetical protein